MKDFEMTDEKIINNPYLDIVDAAVLGKGADASSVITDILNVKISDHLDQYKQDFAQEVFDGESTDDDSDDDDENFDKEELETESDQD